MLQLVWACRRARIEKAERSTNPDAGDRERGTGSRHRQLGTAKTGNGEVLRAPALRNQQEDDAADESNAAKHRRQREALGLLRLDLQRSSVDHGIAISPEHPAPYKGHDAHDDEGDADYPGCCHVVSPAHVESAVRLSDRISNAKLQTPKIAPPPARFLASLEFDVWSLEFIEAA